MIHYTVQTKTNQTAEIEKLRKRVKKLERKKEENSSSKEGRIAEIDANEDLFLIDETAQDQGMIKDQDLFRVHDLDGDEVFVDVTIDELTLARTLMEIKAAKPKAKGAIIDANRQLAKQIQAQEREQLSIEERSKLLSELIESKIKYFAAKRAKEIRNKPPIKAQQKCLMLTYIKNMEGFKQTDFKGKSFDDIKKMFDKVYKRVNTFVDMNTENVEESLKTQAEVTEGSSKRAGQELEQETWYKDKAMLAEAQEAGKFLDEERLVFLADPGVPNGQAVQKIIPNNAAFQTVYLDAYDSNFDDISNAKAVLMANIS
uniref:Uncharacterized protein n=1 Tax=Tanacetum cinerariifolium TaxID=118510 RepID=A0A699IJF8_TANCI|nr:hypothetical protein [Tanacetum cinerariifolium]